MSFIKSLLIIIVVLFGSIPPTILVTGTTGNIAVPNTFRTDTILTKTKTNNSTVNSTGPEIISAKNFQYVNGTANSIYGESVTNIGDYNLDGYQDFIVGGREYNNWQGRVWVYLTGPNGIISPNANFTITGEPDIAQSGICFGHSVANVGDINGDGVTDFVVGGPGSWGGWTVGKEYLFYGNSSTYPSKAGSDANQTFVSPVPYDWLGETVTAVKDFNGDGFPDLAIGAPGSPNCLVQNSECKVKGPNYGVVYIYYGNGHGFSSVPNMTLIDNLTFSGFGLSITSGDLNGDGLSDIAVSAPYTNGNNGTVDIFYGRKGNNETILPSVVINPPDNASLGTYGVSTTNFGNKVSVVKDVFNTSYSDLLIQYESIVNSNVYNVVGMYMGSKQKSYTTPNYILSSGIASDTFGSSIVNIGDTNNNGYNSFAIGAPGSGDNQTLPGSVYVYNGGPNFNGTPNIVYQGVNSQDQFGYAIGTLTVNHKIQLLISATGFNQYAGRVYLTINRIVVTSSPTNSFTTNLIYIIPIVVAGGIILAIAIIIVKRKSLFNKKE